MGDSTVNKSSQIPTVPIQFDAKTQRLRQKGEMIIAEKRTIFTWLNAAMHKIRGKKEYDLTAMNVFLIGKLQNNGTTFVTDKSAMYEQFKTHIGKIRLVLDDKIKREEKEKEFQGSISSPLSQVAQYESNEKLAKMVVSQKKITKILNKQPPLSSGLANTQAHPKSTVTLGIGGHRAKEVVQLSKNLVGSGVSSCAKKVEEQAQKYLTGSSLEQRKATDKRGNGGTAEKLGEGVECVSKMGVGGKGAGTIGSRCKTFWENFETRNTDNNSFFFKKGAKELLLELFPQKDELLKAIKEHLQSNPDLKGEVLEERLGRLKENLDRIYGDLPSIDERSILNKLNTQWINHWMWEIADRD